jgi:AcrR family transcriptional regulator
MSGADPEERLVLQDPREKTEAGDGARPRSTPRLPRTNRVRSALTRQRLRDAALECLAEYGYSGSSIIEISRRAGITPSGIQHHFGGKAELMVAAVRQLDDAAHALLEQMPVTGAFRERFRMVTDEVESFVKPTRAHVELRLAARSDEELARCLGAYYADYQHWGETFQRRMFGDFDPGMEYRALVVACMTGLVIHIDDPEALRAELGRLERMLEAVLT